MIPEDYDLIAVDVVASGKNLPSADKFAEYGSVSVFSVDKHGNISMSAGASVLMLRRLAWAILSETENLK